MFVIIVFLLLGGSWVDSGLFTRLRAVVMVTSSCCYGNVTYLCDLC